MASPFQRLISPHAKDLGGFIARRTLPNDEQLMVGPFIFFDHIGPAVFPPGKAIDVRPHPHINLATVTYLFDGVILHRDSLGIVQEIHPGAVNWMTAGKGIVHSERSPDWARPQDAPLHGIQTWIALPEADEDVDPWFHHHPASDLPSWTAGGATITVIAGHAYGQTSPVKTYSPMLYLDIVLSAGGQFTVEAEYGDRAIYSVTPGLQINGELLDQHRMAVLHPGDAVTITADQASRCMVIGGEPLGTRHKWWNFVSSRPERIEQAKQDWVDGTFDTVPGETEFIPLPDDAEYFPPKTDE
ncbi:MAG: pirin family protein [Cyanobacteria bacterium P01_E01_bin.6]